MFISTAELKETIETKIEEFEPHISTRVHAVLDELISEELTKRETIHVFDLLVLLLLRADSRPVLSIADLLTTLNEDSTELLGKWTLSESAHFISDYLKKDTLLEALERKERQGHEIDLDDLEIVKACEQEKEPPMNQTTEETPKEIEK